ncbi:MAG: hypothetical protein WKF87_06920 [Chryseolinea sp.]
MTIGYSNEYANGVPTFFKYKILKGIDPMLIDYTLAFKTNEDLAAYEEMSPTLTVKIHTIRADNSDRWHGGMKIHHCYHNRTPNRCCFLENECERTQRIQIIFKGMPIIAVNSRGKDVKVGIRTLVIVDGLVMNEEQVETIAKNDGFDSTAKLFEWFENKDFTGKILHWTKLRY